MELNAKTIKELRGLVESIEVILNEAKSIRLNFHFDDGATVSVSNKKQLDSLIKNYDLKKLSGIDDSNREYDFSEIIDWDDDLLPQIDKLSKLFK